MTAKEREEGADRRSKVYVTNSQEETFKLGQNIARKLKIPGVVLMSGALGTGKTTLARGIAAGLEIEDPAAVHSPSFTIVNVYRGKCPIYHVDLYRLEGCRDLYSIGLDDFIGSDGITVVEWSERLAYELPGALVVELEDAGGDRRRIRITEPARQPDGRTFCRRGNKKRSNRMQERMRKEQRRVHDTK